MRTNVTLEPFTLKREREFLEAVRRSRVLHRGRVNPPQTPASYRAYVKRLSTPTHRGFLVVSRASDELIGVINITEIVRGMFKSAYLGCYGFIPHVGHGNMSAGLNLVLRRAFGELHLHRLEANIQPQNVASIKMFSRAGFQREGYSPRYLKIAGRWRDHERWAVLSENWHG